MSCEVIYRGRTGSKAKLKLPKALRLEAAIFHPSDSHVTHVCKFNWFNLDERHAFLRRMEDVLEQGFAVGIKRIDPKAQRLLAKYPAH